MNQMSDVLETTISANSKIRDTDFAQATSNLTRDQIIMEAGVSVLGYANNNPRMLLELLND
jgi:flagellin